MSTVTARVLEWNGRDVPQELASLPPGRYVLTSAPVATPEEWGLSPEDVASLEAGITELDAGGGVSWDALDEVLKQSFTRPGVAPSGT